MASNSPQSASPSVREANRRLRLAIDECQALLRRTEEMLRETQQDNDPRR